MVGCRRIQRRPYGLALFGDSHIHAIPKKIRGVISDFAEIALTKGGEKSKAGGLAALIEQAKNDKKKEKFDKYIGDVIHLWFYQYTENFHCKPDTVEDMVFGLRYLYYAREE